MDFKDYNLKDNPFRIGPTIIAEDIIWAGFKELKETIEKRIQFTMRTTPSRIVLNWGRYGSGKTHAANYFTKTNAAQELANKINAKSIKSIKIPLPRTSKDPVQAFFRGFLGQIGLSQIKEDLKNCKNSYTGSGSFEDLIDTITPDGIIGNLFKLILNFDKEDLSEIEQYLFGDSTKMLLGKLGLPFGIKDDEQIVNFLGTYINLITFNKQLYSAFIIWIDEFEDIDALSKSSQDRITTFIRQVFDTASNNLLLFLNFTPKTFYNIEDLSLTLGEALSTRAKTQISFDIPNADKAKTYIKELLSHYRIKQDSSENMFSPFDESSIEYLLKNIGTLSVRKINEVFSLILEIGLMEDCISIDKNFIDKNTAEIISWEA